MAVLSATLVGCGGHAPGDLNDVQALAIDPARPQTIYAGTLSGVLKSEDGGVHWSRTSYGAGAGVLMIDTGRPTTLYAAGAGVSKSIDGGESWHEVNGGLCAAECPYVKAIAIDPRRPATLYVGTFGDGVFKSTNSGGTWRAINTGLSDRFVSTLAIDPRRPQHVYAGTEMGQDPGSVFWSMNGGETWEAVPGLDEIVSTLLVDPRDPRKLYAGSQVSDLYTSTDAGRSWSPVLLGFREIRSLAVAVKSEVAYVGTRSWGSGERDARVYRSTDHGVSWTPAEQGFGEAAINALAIDPARSEVVYAATDDGVFRSTDQGRTWSRPGAAPAKLRPASTTTAQRPEKALAGSAVGYTYSVVAHPTRSGTAYAGTTNGVFKTTDGGRSWAPAGLEGDAIMGGLAMARSLPTTIYALEPFGDLRKTTDGGATWSETGLHGQEVTVVAVDPKTPTTVYAGTMGAGPGEAAAYPDESAGIFKSTDGGVSWTLAGLLPNVRALAIDPHTPKRLFAGTDAGVFTSTNGGTKWQRTSNGMCMKRRACPVLALAVDPTDAKTLFAGTEKGAFKSTDGGRTWRSLGTRVTGWRIGAVAIDPTAPETVSVGSSGAGGPTGVFQSVDAGRTWRSLGHGLGRQGVSALAVDRSGSTLYTERGEGVLAVDVR